MNDKDIPETVEEIRLRMGDMIENMVKAYEKERASYLGNVVYYPNNQKAFEGAMRKALEHHMLPITLITNKDGKPLTEEALRGMIDKNCEHGVAKTAYGHYTDGHNAAIKRIIEREF